MKRSLPFVAVIALLVVGVVVWRCRGNGDSDAAKSASTATDRTATVAGAVRRNPDPRTLDRASIAGTVVDDAKAPIPRARVCADLSSHDLPGELVRDPKCTNADDAGRYTIRDLLAADYAVSAMAKPFRPGMHHPGGDRKQTRFHVAAGEAKTGIDIMLAKGGVELTGTVADVTGGPVPHASVRASTGWWKSHEIGVAVDADEAGKFSLWVRPGSVSVTAVADGYDEGWAQGSAPGKLEILLTPESSLSGTVVDATTNKPIEGAHVSASASEWGDWAGNQTDITNAQGKFRITRLTPGRYVATARTPNGYGRSEGSTRVGLGQHVDGTTVRVFPARHIEGKVVIGPDKKPCLQGEASLRDEARKHWVRLVREHDGTLHADGVIPGTYSVDAGCPGFQSRDKYDPIKVADKDLTGLEWQVDPGATVRGRVLGKSGAPVADADLWVRSTGGAARAKTNWDADRSTKDGDYELTGLRAGSYKIFVQTDRGVGPNDGFPLDVAASATVQKDLVLEDGGTVKGSVVDADGKPVPGVTVVASADASFKFGGGDDVKSDEDGNFQLTALRPATYRIIPQRSWSDELRKPGTTDDAKQGERVVVKAGQTATVRLTVESQSGSIKGTVTDSDGKPVIDAYVSAVRESDAAGAEKSSVAATRWTWDERPVVTTTDGGFAVTKLSPGAYTLRAYRKGGGEAVAEHVAVGSTAKLQIRPTGSVEGTVVRKGGGAPDEITVELRDLKTGYHRQESYYRTTGRFAVNDLPQGHFTITIDADEGHKATDVDLAEGERKTGIDFELEPLLVLNGRIVELGTTRPVAGIVMFAQPAVGKSFVFRMGNDDLENVSDETGRFTIKNAPQGKLALRGMPKDFTGSDYGWAYTVKTVTGSGTVDIGDIGVVKKRVKQGDPVGDLGVRFQQFSDATPPEEHKMQISYIDPNGPAAKTDLKVGDVILTIDGVDVAGANYGNAWMLMSAPPGTALKLGLERGASVTVVLAAP